MRDVEIFAFGATKRIAQQQDRIGCSQQVLRACPVPLIRKQHLPDVTERARAGTLQTLRFGGR